MTIKEFMSLPEGFLIAERHNTHSYVFAKKPNDDYVFSEDGIVYLGGFRQPIHLWELPTEEDIEDYGLIERARISNMSRLLEQRMEMTKRLLEEENDKSGTH